MHNLSYSLIKKTTYPPIYLLTFYLFISVTYFAMFNVLVSHSLSQKVFSKLHMQKLSFPIDLFKRTYYRPTVCFMKENDIMDKLSNPSPVKKIRAVNPNWLEQQQQIRKSLGLVVTTNTAPNTQTLQPLSSPTSSHTGKPISEKRLKESKPGIKASAISSDKKVDGMNSKNKATKSNKNIANAQKRTPSPVSEGSFVVRFDQLNDDTVPKNTLNLGGGTSNLKTSSSSPFVDVPNRPFTLPPGEFRPKQSLGQNYLSDQNYVNKIVLSFDQHRQRYHQTYTNDTADIRGKRVVEIGPGLGALSRMLHQQYPDMTAVEIDQRAVAVLNEKIPGLNVIHQDVLSFDWRAHSEKVGGKLMIVANLPYHIVSQVLFSLADASDVIAGAVVTMQYEVAERITAQIKNKDYGIPSVVFQLYGKTQLLFKIPPTVFYPVPKVDSALISIDFTQPSPVLSQYRVNMERLRLVVSTAFRQRRKMLRQSLKSMLQAEWAKKLQQDSNNRVNVDTVYGDRGLLRADLPSPWAELRPEHLSPEQFVEMTVLLFGQLTPEEELLQRSLRAQQRLADVQEFLVQGEEAEGKTGAAHTAQPKAVTGTWRRSKAKAALLAAPSNSERKRVKKELQSLQEEHDRKSVESDKNRG